MKTLSVYESLPLMVICYAGAFIIIIFWIMAKDAKTQTPMYYKPPKRELPEDDDLDTVSYVFWIIVGIIIYFFIK